MAPNRDVDSQAWAGHIIPFLARLIDLYSLIVLIVVIVSWVPLDRRHPLVTMTHGLTEPLLAPIRKVLPQMGGLVCRRWFY
jgi:YggT family protein